MPLGTTGGKNDGNYMYESADAGTYHALDYGGSVIDTRGLALICMPTMSGTMYWMGFISGSSPLGCGDHWVCLLY